ncbi:putative ribonuclease H-like domain-containing protein, partial [Tanacetum coccineum]
MNDLERNNMKFPIVSVNTKFLNSLQPKWLKYVNQIRLAKKLTVDSFDDLFDYLSQFKKLVNASRAKKLEKSHDPLALVAHTGSSSKNTSSYYVTHPPSVVDYDEEFEHDDVHSHSEDPLASAMLLLAKAITQNFSNPTNNRLRALFNTRNQAVVQGDRVNIQSRNSGNVGRNNRRAYVQGEVIEGMNATNETANVQRIVRTPTLGNTSTGQCYNCGGKGHYARNCPKPRNDFLFANASRMEEIEELSLNICLMARIQPANQNSDDEQSYESAFVSEVQSSSINKNDEQAYPTHTKIINSTIDDDQINRNIQFDSVKGIVNSGSVEKDYTWNGMLHPVLRDQRVEINMSRKQFLVVIRMTRKSMRLALVNGKMYMLVIVDDFSSVHRWFARFGTDNGLNSECNSQSYSNLLLVELIVKRLSVDLCCLTMLASADCIKSSCCEGIIIMRLWAMRWPCTGYSTDDHNLGRIVQQGTAQREEEGLHKGYDRFLKDFVFGVKVVLLPLILLSLEMLVSGSMPTFSRIKQRYCSISFSASGHSDNIMGMCSAFFCLRRSRTKMSYNNQPACQILKEEKLDATYVFNWVILLGLGICENMLMIRLWYAAFKFMNVKTDETKSFGLVDSMVNWSDHCSRIYTTGEVVERLHNCPLGFQEYFGVDEVFDLSTPSVFYSDPVEKEDKPLYSRFVKAGEMHAVPPPITGTYMPSPYQSDIEETQWTSRLTQRSHASCDSKPQGPRPKEIPPDVDITVFFQNSVPCKFKAASVPAGSRNSSASVPADRSDPAASRNRPAVTPADRPHPAGWSKRPATASAGRPVSAGWLNPAARPFFRPSSVYNTNWSNIYDPMIKGRWGTAVKTSAGYSWRNKRPQFWGSKSNGGSLIHMENPHKNRDLGIVDSGCSRSMTGNKEKLDDFVKIVGGTVTFGGGDGKITGKGTIRTSKLNFENVYYVEELQNFNLFSVSQICDTKNKVLFTDKECLVLSKEFQLPENSQVVLRVPRRNNLYCFNLSDIQPERDVTCLLAKASLDESTKWHRRMAHVNFKNMNKLAKHGLVNGLPSKLFTNEHNCVACNKGKQHKASYKAITAVSTISAPLQLLHMDLFGPTSIRSIDHKYYSLVVTDDFSRFTWVFFLGTKDETYGILKDFITFIENQLTKKVKAIRCDNRTEFKNSKLIKLYGSKGIRRDYSNARTPQQNGVAERKNRTLIEAARTMLADSKLPTMFWTEAVSTACYVLNRVLVTKPHNKTPYELVSGKVPNISHLKPFGCLVTILNTNDYLGKFKGKADEGFIVGYAAHSKAYRVYNLSSKKIEETLNLRYLEDKPNVQGLGHEWYFDLDYLTDSLGYTRFKTNQPAGTQDTNIHAGTQDDSDSECDEQVIVVPSFPSNSFSGPKIELARLQKQAYKANATAEKHLGQADLVASRNKVPAGKIDSAAGVSYRPT